MCIFCKIINREIPAKIVYEDDKLIAFEDIAPKAPIHILIVPKKHTPTINDISSEDFQTIGEVYSLAAKIAKEKGINESGYRVVSNCNKDSGQTVFHIHFHLLGGKPLSLEIGC